MVEKAMETVGTDMQGFPKMVMKLMLKYEYLFDFIKFHTFFAEEDANFMKKDEESIKMGIAGLSSLASSVVMTGGMVGPSGTSMIL